MDKDLNIRTKQFALRIIKLGESLPKNTTGRVIQNQIIKAGTSVAANYRATQMARSNKEFISKMHIVLEECDEVCFWIEMIAEAKLIKEKLVLPLQTEANELKYIFIKSLKTIKTKKGDKSKK